jgi:glycosyltransferase involved in cell wall biosynthesis
MSSKFAPLVSVVVRTMGRPTLARALARIAAQAHRPLETVLVDAAGSLGELPASDIPRIMVRQGKLDRPRAANAGLDAARGEAILFLDEDDEIEPTHVADLLSARANTQGARVAYSQTRLVDAAGNAQRVFGGPFDRMALFRSNYLAIHAVLFERSLVADGCRFDETLPMFEDWDFWLQLAMRTPFAFTGRPTAIYHAAGGQSGAGAGANLDREAVLAHRERLMRKWENARRALAAASESH